MKMPAMDKSVLDRYAQELLGERMQALGFETFKYHRWYKLIRDEVLLSFGLVPTVYGVYELLIGIQPVVMSNMPHFANDIDVEFPYIMEAPAIWEGMRYPYRNVQHGGCEWFPDFDQYGHDLTIEVFNVMVEPTLSRIKNIGDAFEEMHWGQFVMRRHFENFQLNKAAPPAVVNYRIPFTSMEFNIYCFFRMYDACLCRLVMGMASHWDNDIRQYARPDFEESLRLMEEREDQPEQYILLKNRAYEEIDEQLHREYEATLRMIKRRLKLEPDCSDTIWDRDYRHPIDIRRMLQERFDRCAPRAAQGDYTIDFI